MQVEGIVGVCDLLVSSPSLSAAIYYFLPQQCHLGQRGCVFCNDLVLYCLGPFTVKKIGCKLRGIMRREFIFIRKRPYDPSTTVSRTFLKVTFYFELAKQ